MAIIDGVWIRTLLAGVTVTAVLAGCQSPSSESGSGGPLWAFRANAEIGLVQGAELLMTVPGEFAPTDEPIATEDGRFVFGRSPDGTLTVVDAESRHARTLAAEVGSRMGTGGGSTVVWVEQPDRLMQVDLAVADPTPTLRRTVDLPQNVAASGPPVLIASRGDVAVVARVESAPPPAVAPQMLYALRGAAPPVPLEETLANTPIENATMNPDGDSVAYGVYRRSGADCGKSSLTIIDLDQAAPRTIRVGQRDAGIAERVLKLWWAGITPELSTVSWNCADPQIGKVPSISEVRGLSLHPAMGESALQTLDLAAGVTATLLPREPMSREPVGNLIVDVRGEKTGVRGGVSAIASLS